MNEILILGNGISRLSHHDFIMSWPGQIWGCNYVFNEYGKQLSVLTGHVEVMEQAKKEKEKNQYKFKIYSGHIGKNEFADMHFSCSKKYQKDSGTTLIAEALTNGFNVVLCGFDIGGPDILSPGLEKQLKHNWVERFREIINDFGSDRIKFIGHNHMPFLLSDESSLKYSMMYRKGLPHILDQEYIDQWEKWKGKKFNNQGSVYTMVKVKFIKNGFETVMNEQVAAAYKAKGKIDIIGQKKEKAEKDPEKGKKEDPGKDKE